MKMPKMLFSIVLLLLLMLQTFIFHETNVYPNKVLAAGNNVFYVDPVKGNIKNDGSIDKPWSTLQEVIENNLIETMQPQSYPYDGTGSLITKNEGAPVKAGDTIILRDGFHGELSILRAYNSDYITIKAQEGQNPTLSRISITAGSKWHLKRLTVSPEYAKQYKKGNIISISKHGYSGPAYYITVEECTAYSVKDSSKWTLDDWNTKSCTGISSSGHHVRIENNFLKNVNFGISISGNNSVVKHNIIENFAGDGMRGIADDLLFEGNIIKNCYDVNENHDDGFQSWAVNGDPPERVTLRGNLFINYEDPNQPFLGPLQGIGLFDGPYIDWIIENNIVSVNHWHGISIYGGVNCKIINNTVVDPDSERPGPAWIMVNNMKNGEPNKDCIVRNNIAPTYSIKDGVISDHNYKVTNYDELFVDYKNSNFHIKKGAPVIDTGSPEFSPDKDFAGFTRPYGGIVDIGAYEYHNNITGTTPEDDKIDIIPSKTSFSDVFSKYWAYEAISSMVEKGILCGYPDNSFKPDKPITRAEFAKIMMLALKLEQNQTSIASYKDVATEHWAFKFVECTKSYFAEAKFANSDYYRPSEEVEREDVAVALVNALGLNDETPDYSILYKYSDEDKISKELRGYIAIAIKHGIMKGYPAGTDGKFTFGPRSTLTRSEAAMLIFKASNEKQY